jgi:hypothetical protein
LRPATNACGSQLLVPPVLPSREPHLQFVCHVDLIDQVSAEERRPKVVDHAAMGRIAQKVETCNRGFWDYWRIDIGNVRQIGVRAIVTDQRFLCRQACDERMLHRKGVEFPYWLELIDKIVVVVGLLAKLTACHLLAADGAARIAQDVEIAVHVGKSVVDGQFVRPRPGIVER